MYSYEQRKKAIETYLRTQSVSETLRVLGYPSSKELYKWIHEYQQNGKLHKKRVKPERIYYTEEEKAAAVQFYHDISVLRSRSPSYLSSCRSPIAPIISVILHLYHAPMMSYSHAPI